MGALVRRCGPIIGVVLLGYSLISACTPQGGSSTSSNRGSSAEVSYKTAFIFDDPPDEVVSQGDKALAGEDYVHALKRYEEASKDVNEKVQASALNRMGELYERGLGVERDFTRSIDLYQ
jgi:TPR repeat protein